MDALSRDPANAGVTFAHAAPGFVATNWGTDLPWAMRAVVRCLQARPAPLAWPPSAPAPARAVP